MKKIENYSIYIGRGLTHDHDRTISMPINTKILDVLDHRSNEHLIFVTLQDTEEKKVEDRRFKLVTTQLFDSDQLRYIATVRNPYTISVFEILKKSEIRNNKLEELINENENPFY